MAGSVACSAVIAVVAAPMRRTGAAVQPVPSGDPGPAMIVGHPQHEPIVHGRLCQARRSAKAVGSRRVEGRGRTRICSRWAPAMGRAISSDLVCGPGHRRDPVDEEHVTVVVHMGGIEPADLIGFSMAAPSPSSVAIDQPDLVRSLVSISAHFHAWDLDWKGWCE